MTNRLLLDVNVLLALGCDAHVHHDAAHARFSEVSAWSTTPITELGFVRLMLTEAVIGRSVRPADALDQLRAFRAVEGWSWISDDMSPTVWPSVRGVLRGRRQVTDLQLVAIAAANGCRVATFDEGIKQMLPPQERHLVEVWR